MFLYYRHENNIIIEQVDKEYYDTNPDSSILIHKDGKLDVELLGQGFYIIASNGRIGLSESYWAKDRLKRTDWKVTKHRDQLALGVPTSLSDEEYQTLLAERQSWREKASN